MNKIDTVYFLNTTVIFEIIVVYKTKLVLVCGEQYLKSNNDNSYCWSCKSSGWPSIFYLSQKNKINLSKIFPSQVIHSLIKISLQVFSLSFILYTAFLKSICDSLKSWRLCSSSSNYKTVTELVWNVILQYIEVYYLIYW